MNNNMIPHFIAGFFTLFSVIISKFNLSQLGEFLDSELCQLSFCLALAFYISHRFKLLRAYVKECNEELKKEIKDIRVSLARFEASQALEHENITRSMQLNSAQTIALSEALKKTQA